MTTRRPFRVARHRVFTLPNILLLVGLLCGACQPGGLQGDVVAIDPPEPLHYATPLSREDSPEGLGTPDPLPTFYPTPTRRRPPGTVQPSATSSVNGAVGTAQVPPAQSPIRYLAQSGDSLAVVATRFGVQPDEIVSPQSLPEAGLLSPGQLLLLPPRRWEMISPAVIMLPSKRLLPDSEIVFGPSAVDFEVDAYLKQVGGYLGTHREYLGTTAWTKASDVLTRIALENSINPRLLLALLEYECGCVLGGSTGRLAEGYALGVEDFHHKWLYGQLGWAANQLSIGYYGWRTGLLREIPLPNGIIMRPAPDSNAGSVALQYYFASLAAQKAKQRLPVGQQSIVGPIPIDDAWLDAALEPESGFAALHRRMFGDAWERAETVEPLFPLGLSQPDLILPFEPGVMWSYTSGPHKAWQTEGALAALDFAPASKESECVISNAWVVAVADGPVVRSGHGFVIQDLDGVDASGHPAASDGVEQTGWAILYMHVESRDRVAVGTYLRAGDQIGHPSCEGGPATGTHLHIARKYNGEWVIADGPLPFVLSGWVSHAGQKPYEGTLTKDEQTIIAHPYGSFETLIFRPEENETSDSPTVFPIPDEE